MALGLTLSLSLTVGGFSPGIPMSGALLLEDGVSYLLLEDGVSKLLLE